MNLHAGSVLLSHSQALWRIWEANGRQAYWMRASVYGFHLVLLEPLGRGPRESQQG